MPRINRIIIPDVPHHICHRGNNQQAIVHDDNDRLKYLSILKKSCDKRGLNILGYCLMDNHIHLVAVPSDENSLSSAIQVAHGDYARRFNYRYEIKGHLWEGRYYSCPLDDAHFIQALLYVDRNPVRAGMVKDLSKYRWSSIHIHTGKGDPADLVKEYAWARIQELSDYKTQLLQEEDKMFVDRIRLSTKYGQPAAIDKGIQELEAKSGYPFPKKANPNPKHQFPK
jgi:putative transposase